MNKPELEMEEGGYLVPSNIAKILERVVYKWTLSQAYFLDLLDYGEEPTVKYVTFGAGSVNDDRN